MQMKKIVEKGEKNMAVKMIVGLQYGDEGKGRAVHYEAKNASIVIRATGGSNAGHTVVANGKKYAMHLLPSAIIRPDVLSMIGPGVVADLKVLAEEIEQMAEAGVKIEKENFAISQRTHITLPHHKQLDRLYEMLKDNKVGTTGRGVGTTYEEKARRTNVRMCDLFCEEKRLFLPEDCRFALLVSEALENIKRTEFAKTIRLFRKALKYCPAMTSVVREVIRQICIKAETPAQNTGEEFQMLAHQMKEALRTMIDNADYTQALPMIQQLTPLLPEDLELLRMRQNVLRGIAE